MKQQKKGMAEFKSQIMLLILGMILAINFLLALTLLQTAPQLKLLAQIVPPELSRTNQALRVTPLESSPIYDEEMEEFFVRSYLDWRWTYIPDLREMLYRWGPGGPVWWLSSAAVYGKFYQGEKWLEQYIKEHTATQSIDIKSVYHLDNIWTIELEAYSFLGEKVTSKTFVINLKTSYKGRVLMSKRLINPRGFMVIEYSAKEKRG